MRSLLLRHSAAVTTIIALAIIAFAIAQASSRASVAEGAVAAPPDWAIKTALAVAAANGDASPESVQYAVSTPARIAAFTDEVSSDAKTQLCVVLMRGDFTLYTAHLPIGVEPPAADWILLTLDPSDQHVAGMAAARGAPDVTALGATRDVTAEVRLYLAQQVVGRR